MARSPWTASAAVDRLFTRRPVRRGMNTVFLCVLSLLGIGFGMYHAWSGGVALPREYRTLARSGVPVTLTLGRCATGMHGDRSFECEVTLPGAHSSTWIYPGDTTQFSPYTPGTHIAALRDPVRPLTAYTLRDVNDRYDAGWTSPQALAGSGVALVGVVLGAFAGVTSRRRCVTHSG